MEDDDIPQISNAMSVFPKPERMFPADARPAGGQYIDAATKQDVTGHQASMASVGVLPGGKPFFNVSRDSAEQVGSSGRGTAISRTNLFKQKAGWKWLEAPEGHEDTNTIVSTDHRNKHYYSLNAHYPKGVDLARYPKKKQEPKLRPTTRGNLTLGNQVGRISVRGAEHPVYDHVIMKADGGIVGDPNTDEGITAYHGSPHDFERFDMSKISGQGQQAYGHGLYFAEHEPSAKEHAGHMYEVRINAHPDHFIDWDKPIKDHSDLVRSVAKNLGVNENAKGGLLWNAAANTYKGPTDDDDFGTGKIHPSAPHASSMLSKAGIKGIRYLDPASLQSIEKGAHNYVVFDDKLVNVKRKYAQGGDVGTTRYHFADGGKVTYNLKPDNDDRKHAGYKDDGGKMTWMSPDKFLAQTQKMKMDKEDKKSIKRFEKKIKKGKGLNPLAIYPSGGQDGRHRATAAKHEGIKKIPVVQWPKKADGGAIGYAGGGDVEYQSTGDKVVNDGAINWGSSDSPADFFRADKALQQLRPEMFQRTSPTTAAVATETRPTMPAPVANPPAIVAPAATERESVAQAVPPRQPAVQPSNDQRYGLFAVGTNDFKNPKVAYQNALNIIDNAAGSNIKPVLLLPNSNDPRFRDVSEAVRRAAEERGITYHVPEYDPNDPLHMTRKSAQSFAKQYPNAFLGGDSNIVRLANWGYGLPTSNKGNAYIDPQTGMMMGRVGAGSAEISNWLAKYRQSLQQRKRGGSIVERALMVTSKSVNHQRGRP